MHPVLIFFLQSEKKIIILRRIVEMVTVNTSLGNQIYDQLKNLFIPKGWAKSFSDNDVIAFSEKRRDVKTYIAFG